MEVTLQALQMAAFNWTLPSIALPWIDVTFIVGLVYLYGQILHWMRRGEEFFHTDELVTRVLLVYLVIFCGLAWMWRGELADMRLDAAPYLKYGILMVPAMGHGFIMKWVTSDREHVQEVLELVDHPDRTNDPLKVQYAVSMIFVVFCWAYLAHLE